MNLSAMAYPKDSGDFFEDISNGEGDNRTTHLAAIMAPYIILFVVIMIGIGFMAAICGCCCFMAKERRRGRGQSDIEKKPNEIVVVMDCDNDKGYTF